MENNRLNQRVFKIIAPIVAVTFFVGLGAGMAFSGANLSSEAQTQTGDKKLSELVVAIVPQADVSKFEAQGKMLEDYFSAKTGMNVRLYYPLDDTTTISSIRSGTTHIAFITSRPAQLAHELTDGKTLAFMAELRPFKTEDGTEKLGTSYVSQYWVLADSKISSLEDARGKSVAFSSPLSTGGYLFPVAKLVKDGLMPPGNDPKKFFGQVLFSGGYQQSLMALLRGDVDVAAGDDWAVHTFLTPEEQGKIRIIANHGPIPTHSVIYRSDIVPVDVITKFEKAVIDISTQRPELAEKALFGALGFVPVNHHAHLDTLENALAITKIPAVP